MLKLPLLALFLRTIPEGLILIWCSYVLMDTRVNKLKLLVSGILLGVGTFFVRMLPINFGVHVIFVILMITILLYKMNNFNLFKAVYSSILSALFITITDLISVAVFFLFNIPVILDQSFKSTIIGFAALICPVLTLLLIIRLKKYNYRKKQNIKL